MNRDQIKQNLPIFQAFAEGKIIQYQSRAFGGKWADVKDATSFNFDEYDYRVKPEPKTIFVLMRGDGTTVGRPYTDKALAIKDRDSYAKTHGHVYGPYTLEEYVQVVK